MNKNFSFSQLAPLLVLGSAMLLAFPTTLPTTSQSPAPPAASQPATTSGVPSQPPSIPAAPLIAFTDMEELNVTLSPDSQGNLIGKATVFLRNGGGPKDEKSVENINAFLRNTDGDNLSGEITLSAADLNNPPRFEQFETRAVQIDVTLKKEGIADKRYQAGKSQILSGYLIVGAGGLQQFRPVKLTVPIPFRWPAYSCLASSLSLVCAFLGVLVSYLWNRQSKLGISKFIRISDWSPNGSLATNMTAVSGALGISAMVGLLSGNTRYLPKTEYTSLVLFFSLLPLIAPIIYRSILAPVEGSSPPQFQSRVWLFLVSSIVTLWGTIGQIPMALLVLGELDFAGLASSTIVRIFQALFVVLAIFILAHSFRTIHKNTRKPDPNPNEPPPAPVAIREDAAVQSAPTWQLF